MTMDEVMKIDKLADDLNKEVGELAFGLKPGYDWHLMTLMTQAQKEINAYFDATLARTTNDSNARLVFRKLRERFHSAMQLSSKTLVKYTTPKAVMSFMDVVNSTEDMINSAVDDLSDKLQLKDK